MMQTTLKSAFVLALTLFISLASAQDLKPIPLPKPRTDIGRPFMQVVKDRQSIRDITAEKLPLQNLSELLWAGFGINRAANAHRTAPSAMNSQEIDIYVASADGLFLYEAAAHQLKPILAQDIRLKTGSGAFSNAPLSLIFVADYSRLTKAKPEDKLFYAAIDTGFISENIYLYCASEGLASVVHMAGDSAAALAKTMGLKPNQKIVIAQAVGWPKK